MVVLPVTPSDWILQELNTSNFSPLDTLRMTENYFLAIDQQEMDLPLGNITCNGTSSCMVNIIDYKNKQAELSWAKLSYR